jgi:hypothetical protein
VIEVTQDQTINFDPGTVSGFEWVETYDMLQRHWPQNKKGTRPPPRLVNAARRMVARRNHKPVPPRLAFKSTVDYYEAVAPLMAARSMWEAPKEASSHDTRPMMMRSMFAHWPVCTS